MISLQDKIYESLYGGELILEELQSVWKRTAKNAAETGKILDTLQGFCKAMKGKKISLDNKQETRKAFKQFTDMMPFGNKGQILSILKNYGLSTEEGFRKFILGSHDEMEKAKYDIDWVKNWDETEMEKEYKKAKQEGLIPRSISDDEADDRDLVIYDRWDPHSHQAYEFEGKRGKSTDHQVNMIRMEFKYEYGVKYYDCYPILAKNYYGHEDELKRRADLQIGYDLIGLQD